MKPYIELLLGISLLVFTCNFKSSFANNPDYEQRRTAYVDTALANFSGDAITLQAYQGLPVDQSELNNLLNSIPTKSTADFGIVKLIRVLLFGNGAYAR